VILCFNEKGGRLSALLGELKEDEEELLPRDDVDGNVEQKEEPPVAQKEEPTNAQNDNDRKDSPNVRDDQEGRKVSFEY
jgi:hypothetical protein